MSLYLQVQTIVLRLTYRMPMENINNPNFNMSKGLLIGSSVNQMCMIPRKYSSKVSLKMASLEVTFALSLLAVALQITLCSIIAKAFECFNQKLAGGWVMDFQTGGFPTNETCEYTSLKKGFPCFVEERPVVYCEAKYVNDAYYRKVR